MNFSDVLNLASRVTVDQMLKRDMFQKRTEEKKIIRELFSFLKFLGKVRFGIPGQQNS